MLSNGDQRIGVFSFNLQLLAGARITATFGRDCFPSQMLMGEEGSNAQVQTLIGVAHFVQRVVQIGDADLVPTCL